ncbi:MAG: PAS domain-containing protein, partial [Proteobacteria bacterium]|nr:PAS domain-containing protein [Pseudomonadota bacterium]
MAGRRTRRELKERIAELERRLLDLEQTAGGRLEPEDIFHRVADHSREVFWIKDLSSGRFVYVSPSYDNLYGRRREDLLDDPEDFIRAVHPDDRPGVLAAVRDQDGGGPNFNREFRLQLPDGSIRWIWARTFPLPDEDG